MHCGNYHLPLSRRQLLSRSAYGLGAAALQSLMAADAFKLPAAPAKRVIFLFQAGGPSHLDLLDYKPQLKARYDQDIPPSVFGTQRITGMVANQDRFPVMPTMYGFQQRGQSGRWLSNLLPHHGKHRRRDLCAQLAAYRSHKSRSSDYVFADRQPTARAGPSMGSWIDYGLGAENQNLPAFVVLNSLPGNGMADQGLLARLWGAGFLPSRYQGVQFRSGRRPRAASFESARHHPRTAPHATRRPGRPEPTRPRGARRRSGD